jgi:hypothetical protein
MARVLLVSANASSEPYQVYPLGLEILRQSLSSSGHQVRIFDPLVSGRQGLGIKWAIDEFCPGFIAVSLRNIDNVDSCSGQERWYLLEARELVRKVRRCTDQPVIIGGSGFSLLPKEIMAFLGADYGVVGEGERSLPWLVEQLSQGKRPPRLIEAQSWFKRLSGREIFGAKDQGPLREYYLENSGVIGVQSKRGCNYRCSYCPYPVLEPGPPRKRDVGEVVEEVKALQGRSNLQQLFFVDSVFNDPDGHYLQLAEELLRQGVQVDWLAFFRPALSTAKELGLLKRAGLQAIELGTDASTDATLRGMNKSFDLDTVFRFQEACARQEIPCAHYVIFGGPGEDVDSVRQGIDNLNGMEHCVVFVFAGIRLLKQTPLYEQALSEGVVSPEDPLLKPTFYFSPQVDQVWLNRELEAGFAGRSDRIFPLAKGMDKMRVMRKLGYQGVLWDKLIRF